MSTLKKYYEKNGNYLEEHRKYLTPENLKRDADFISESLGLTKQDKCLDLQCAQGRLAVELAKRGFDVDGLDFSEFLINLAKKSAHEENLKIDFFLQGINDIKLPKKYSKVFMYFPDWTDLDLQKVLENVGKIMVSSGLFLYDHDNISRIQNYLRENPKEKEKFVFDNKNMILFEKGDTKGDKYYTLPELEKIFNESGFKIIKTFGGWNIKDGEYKSDSPRIRIVAKNLSQLQ